MKNLWWMIIGLVGCQTPSINPAVSENKKAEVQVVGAMRQVMHQGKLDAQVRLDSLGSSSLFGIGPLAGLQGEIMLWQGQAWVARVASDSLHPLKLSVEPQAGAPFFVFAEVDQWLQEALPESVNDLKSLDHYLAGRFGDEDVVFKLEGSFSFIDLHVQNLADGAVVRSPEEAHAGQVNHQFSHELARVLGFYSNHQQGVYTHHDANSHLHVQTNDNKWMGHADALRWNSEQVAFYVGYRKDRIAD